MENPDPGAWTGSVSCRSTNGGVTAKHQQQGRGRRVLNRPGGAVKKTNYSSSITLDGVVGRDNAVLPFVNNKSKVCNAIALLMHRNEGVAF
ncbi:MAG: hypothetical protein V4726_10785 [Verrucomicrobiota bacterium]